MGHDATAPNMKVAIDQQQGTDRIQARVEAGEIGKRKQVINQDNPGISIRIKKTQRMNGDRAIHVSV